MSKPDYSKPVNEEQERLVELLLVASRHGITGDPKARAHRRKRMRRLICEFILRRMPR